MASVTEIQDDFEGRWLELVERYSRTADAPPELEFALQAAGETYHSLGIGRSRRSVEDICMAHRQARVDSRGRPPKREPRDAAS